MDQVEVVAISDQNPQRIDGLDVRTCTDWRELLSDPGIDLLAIVTEPSTHKDIAIACMEAGKHVLVEKPLAVTLEDAREILATRDRTGRATGIDFIMRFNPLLQTLRELTQNGIFGKLRRVAVENYAQDAQLPLDHWFWNPERSGGILVEHGVHFIDLVHFLSPAPLIAVNGLKHDRNPGQEDQIMANMVYEGGLVATHYHSFSRPGFFEVTRIKLGYDLADLELHGWIPLWADVKALVNAETKRALSSNPYFELAEATPIGRVADDSRPEGWGSADKANSGRQTLRSGGIEYQVEEQLTGQLHLRREKLDVYRSCVQDSLRDVLQKIEDPRHKQQATLETGLLSLDLALRATASARKNPL